MIREITLGQYYPADSVLHRLDPRTKLFGAIVYIAALFLCTNWVGYALAVLCLAFFIILSKVPLGFMVKGLKSIAILLLISVSFNLFLTKGEPIVSLGPVHITKEGLKVAVFMAIRLTCLVMGTSLLTLTTTPNMLTDGMEKGLGFLNKIGIPVHEISMMMSIALRFIPILIEETDKIMKAQMARGANFEEGGLVKKAKGLIPLLVPLFISAFRRATDLATAMEARCYHGGEGRTKMKPLQYKTRDYIAYAFIFAMLAAFIVIRTVKQ